MGSDALEDYILAHTEPEPDYLYRLWRATNIHTIHGRMASGHLQGRLLKMLVQMIRPERILEVGTFSGYSAISMAEGLTGDGHLYTFEINDEMEDFLLQLFEKRDPSAKIKLHIGDAIQIIPTIDGWFDVVFMDGNKRHYVEYYETVMPKLRLGGLIIADNTLWDGHVLEETRDAQTVGIQKFNDLIMSDDRVEKVIIPVRDGMTLIRKIKN